jgi:two-component system phosphate regulon sensor histidine kinase PhoR
MSDDAWKTALLKLAFPDLAEDLLDVLGNTAEVVTYPADTTLCREGHPGHTFYIIEDGEVAFTMRMEDDDTRLLRVGGRGEFFGEMALLDENYVRSVTAKSLMPTTLLEIKRDAFVQLITDAPSLAMNLAKTISQRMRENDRRALAEVENQKREVEEAYAALQRIDEQRHQFLNTMAHELRTPLTTVTGYMQLIRSGLVQGPGLQQTLEKVGSGLDRMVSLINDLFFWQELETLEPHFRRVDLTDVLDEVIERARRAATIQNVDLTLNISTNLPYLTAEFDGLVRAFWHLVDNAIKFSPEGGNVVVSAQRDPHGAIVQISDQGVGIDPDFMPRLFDRFERDEEYEGKYLFGGVGLGMPIVKQIIGLHNGEIAVESERGRGTRFEVFLPLDSRRSTIELNVDDAWFDMPD